MRTAIFGGTFDPIHRAHLRVAQEAADRFGLDQVLLITSGNPPHKPAGATTSYEHRHRMVELACECDLRLKASRLEAGRLLSYSYDTIQLVRASLAAGDELLFLIGADAFAEIGTWYRADEVVRAVEFIVKEIGLTVFYRDDYSDYRNVGGGIMMAHTIRETLLLPSGAVGFHDI